MYSYLSNLITGNTCRKTLRSPDNMQIPIFNTVRYGKRSIAYITPLLWNNLANEMKTSRTPYSSTMLNDDVSIECKCGFCVSRKITC